MSKKWAWAHVFLEIVGALAIVAGLGWGAFYLTFKNFAGGNCTDTEQQTLPSPDKKHTVMSLHRECGGHTFFFVYISTGNDNRGYEYAPIAQINNVAPDKAFAAWKGSDQVVVTYPSNAVVVDAYAKTFGVRITLNPPLP
jgi:hypothetical protein